MDTDPARFASCGANVRRWDSGSRRSSFSQPTGGDDLGAVGFDVGESVKVLRSSPISEATHRTSDEIGVDGAFLVGTAGGPRFGRSSRPRLSRDPRRLPVSIYYETLTRPSPFVLACESSCLLPLIPEGESDNGVLGALPATWHGIGGCGDGIGVNGPRQLRR